MLTLETRYLEYTSGTKFYEIVLLKSLKTSNHMLVRRWGSMSERDGAGQVKIERFQNESAAIKAMAALLKDKRKTYPDGGTYQIYTSSYGLHGMASAMSVAAMLGEVKKHYANQTVLREAKTLFEAGNVTIVLPDELEEENEIIEEGAPVATPVKRDSDWGSW